MITVFISTPLSGKPIVLQRNGAAWWFSVAPDDYESHFPSTQPY